MTSLSENTVVTTSGGLVELGYLQSTTTVTPTSTTGGSGTDVIGPLTFVSDGSPVVVQFYSYGVQPKSNTNSAVIISLYEDGVEKIREFGTFFTPAAATSVMPANLSFRYTPTIGIHTVQIKAFCSAGAGTPYIFAGNGGTGGGPIFLRVSKVVQASQFIVPLASAPLVTSLPSAPIDGQEIRYLADATNGVIWNLRYRAASSSAYKWEFVGGAPLSASTISGITGTISSTSFVSASGGNISVSLPLAGDYWTTTTILGTNNTGGAWWMGGLDGPGSTIVDQFCARLMTSSANYFQNGAASILRTFTSSGTVDMKYRVTSGIATIAERGFSLTPIRVG